MVVAETAPGEFTAFFGDDGDVLHALDARTGEPRRDADIYTHVATRLTGSPVYHDGRLYVTASSGEEGLAMQKDYPCCTFRGSLGAIWPPPIIDAARGEVFVATGNSYTNADAACCSHRRRPVCCGRSMRTARARWFPGTGGAELAGGRLSVNSGYAPFRGRPGNALLVFSVDGKNQ